MSRGDDPAVTHFARSDMIRSVPLFLSAVAATLALAVALPAQARNESLRQPVDKRCWLYAADDRVVWSADVGKRIGSAAQLGGTPPADTQEEHR